MTANEEIFDVVDELGHVIGAAPRARCHGDPSLLHQSVHVLVFDRLGRLFLQKRSRNKDMEPGKWDTSVGGHLQQGEPAAIGAGRELQEELGIHVGKLDFAYQYVWRSSYESELVRAFVTLHEGPFQLCPEEIEEGRFWAFDEIDAALQTGCFTPQFVHEFPRMREWWNRKQASMTHFTR